MKPVGWLPPHGPAETALACDRGRKARLLVIPALFDEANKLRRLTVEVMRRLDRAGVDCFLPDPPGCNESTAPLEIQTPESWRAAMRAAAAEFAATHVLALRGGALIAPEGLPGWHYAPVKGAAILRQMLRARTLAAREAGREETAEAIMAAARGDGVELAGYRLGAAMVRAFETLTPAPAPGVFQIDQDMIGGSGLWLRAEPSENRMQADALAAIIAVGIAS